MAAVPLGRKCFIEIGTCDFDTCFTLARNGWEGIMIEPSPIPYENMAAVNKNFKRIKTLNLAISDHDGELEFGLPDYTSKGEDAWRRGIGSVLTDSHKGFRAFDYLENYPINKARKITFLDKTITVPCMTLDTLITKNKIVKIDFLKIDVEGHELNILDSYSWKIKPTMIKIEHRWCKPDREILKKLLEDVGYMIMEENYDYYAII